MKTVAYRFNGVLISIKKYHKILRDCPERIKHISAIENNDSHYLPVRRHEEGIWRVFPLWCENEVLDVKYRFDFQDEPRSRRDIAFIYRCVQRISTQQGIDWSYLLIYLRNYSKALPKH